MHRRARHLNPGSAGAVMALDSRFITGLSDGDPVSTWSDRSASANNVTQSGTARPTFETNEQGGQPVLLFDGTDDFLNGGDILDMGTNSLTMIVVAKRTSGVNTTLAGKSRAGPGSGRYSLLRESNNMIAVYDSGGGVFVPSIADTSTAARINTLEIQRSVAVRIIFNGTQQVSSTITGTDTNNLNSTDSFFVGAYQGSGGSTPPLGGYYWNGTIAQVLIMFQVNTPLRRRLEHAAAYSFKLSCN
jgi:hypothetical protein